MPQEKPLTHLDYLVERSWWGIRKRITQDPVNILTSLIILAHEYNQRGFMDPELFASTRNHNRRKGIKYIGKTDRKAITRRDLNLSQPDFQIPDSQGGMKWVGFEFNQDLEKLSAYFLERGYHADTQYLENFNNTGYDFSLEPHPPKARLYTLAGIILPDGDYLWGKKYGTCYLAEINRLREKLAGLPEDNTAIQVLGGEEKIYDPDITFKDTLTEPDDLQIEIPNTTTNYESAAPASPSIDPWKRRSKRQTKVQAPLSSQGDIKKDKRTVLGLGNLYQKK